MTRLIKKKITFPEKQQRGKGQVVLSNNDRGGYPRRKADWQIKEQPCFKSCSAFRW
jgi:hypothetical protein